MVPPPQVAEQADVEVSIQEYDVVVAAGSQ